MTINELVSQIRMTLKSHTDDSDLSDQYFYDLVKSYRATLLKRQAQKHNPISKVNYQSLCVELAEESAADCIDCEKDISCCVLKSTLTLPEAIFGRNNIMMKVRLLSGKEISYVSSYTQHVSNQWSKTRANEYSWTLDNGKLVVYGTNVLRYVIVEGVFQDPTQLSDFNTCGSSQTESCFDVRHSSFPVEDSMFSTIRQMIYKEMGVYLQAEEDNINDSRQQKPNQV